MTIERQAYEDVVEEFEWFELQDGEVEVYRPPILLDDLSPYDEMILTNQAVWFRHKEDLEYERFPLDTVKAFLPDPDWDRNPGYREQGLVIFVIIFNIPDDRYPPNENEYSNDHMIFTVLPNVKRTHETLKHFSEVFGMKSERGQAIGYQRILLDQEVERLQQRN